MTRFTRRVRVWRHAWLHSDLLGIPVTVGLVLIFLVCVGVFFLLGNIVGLFVAKAAFVVLLGGFLTFFLLISGRHTETMDGVTLAREDGSHRVLVIANRGLEEPALCVEVCARGARARTEAMVIAPVVSASWFHTLADDVDSELGIAQGRVDAALGTLASKGIEASGHPAFGQPMTALLDGLREFPASEVVMLNGGEEGWEDAGVFAQRVRDELGLRVTEVDPGVESPNHNPTVGIAVPPKTAV